MIPTIYPTIFLTFEFSSDLKSFDIIKHHKLGPNFLRGGLASYDEAEWLYAEPFNTDGIIAKYYPECLI